MRWPVFVYFLLTLSGCTWQIYHIAHEYFEYDTVTQLTIVRSVYASPPTVIICFMLKSIIDKGTQEKLNVNASDDHSLKKLTVDNIFDITPKVTGFIKKCKVRAKQGYHLDKMDSEDCHKNIEVKKFFKMRYICYSITLKPKLEYFVHYLTNSIEGPKYYQIMLEHCLPTTQYYLFYVHNARLSFYGRSDSFMEHFRDIKNETAAEGDCNFVTLSYKRFESKLLKPPYETKCFDYEPLGFESRDHCYEDCVKGNCVEQLDKMPFGVAVYTPSALRVISSDDIRNETFGNNLYRIERECQARCKQPDCVVEDFSPKVIQSEKFACGGFELYATNEPDVITEFKEKTSLVDFLTMILSCIGFWFGFSPLFFMKDFDIITVVMKAKKGISAKVRTRKTLSISSFKQKSKAPAPSAPPYDSTRWSPAMVSRQQSGFTNDTMIQKFNPKEVHSFQFNYEPLFRKC